MNRRVWLLVLPLVGTIFGYARALRGEFVFDDLPDVVHDPVARNLAVSTRALLPSLLSAGRSLAASPSANAQVGNYPSPGLEGGRGFVTWTLALNHACGGLDPFGYHLVNLGLHLIVTVLVFFFTNTLLKRAVAANSGACALAVAGAFALHPLHSQAVNYITQRSEVLASGMYLGALLLLLRASAARRRAAVFLLILALFIFALGLGTKVIVVTLPAVYLLVVLVVPDRRPGAARPGWERHFALTVPLLFLAAWKTHALLVSVKGHTDAGFSVGVPGENPWTYFLTEWKVVLVYARLIFWPSGQSLDWLYPISARLDPTVGAAGLALLVAAAVAVTLAWRARQREGAGPAAVRVTAFGIFWFLVVLMPTSTFVPLADLLVEHRAYLASVGLLVAAATLAARLTARLPARAGTAAVAIAWTALGIALYQRNAVWETPTALWSDVVAKRPWNGRAHMTLARIHQEHGNLPASIAEYSLAAKTLPPSDTQNRLAAAQGLAAALADAGRPTDAVAVTRAALALKPGDPTMLATLAAAQLRAGELEEAEHAAQAALDAQPGHSQALLTLGEIRFSRGDAAGAAHFLAAAVEIEPHEPIRLLEYGRTLAQLGRREEACRAWLEAAQSPEAGQDDRNGAARFAAKFDCPIPGILRPGN